VRTRDQDRARHAHECIDHLDRLGPEHRADYRVLANDFGANVMRSGLCGALAFIERRSSKAGRGSSSGGSSSAGSSSNGSAADLFLDHLAVYLGACGLPGLPEGALGGRELHGVVRRLPLARYILITREVLHVALWMRRACQARISSPVSPASPHPGDGGPR